MSEALTHPVVLFDGTCGFCNASVQFIIKRDKHALFRFAPLQSEKAAELLSQADWHGPLPDSVILIEPATLGGQSRVLVMSDASIAIATKLGFPWSLAKLAKALPLGLRNAAYKLIAKHRYKVFGKSETCSIPSEATRARFLA